MVLIQSLPWKRAKVLLLEVGMKITVTPHITSDGFVSMDLDVVDETLRNPLPDDAVFTGGSIYFRKSVVKAVKTSIMVADGDTAVIGGMMSNQVSDTEQRVPVLGSIPVLGHLFRRTEEATIQRNLTIFITPRVVDLSKDDEVADLKLQLRESLSGLNLRPVEEN